MNKTIVESLESRVLLSYNVTSLADNGNSGTLRWAIQQADAAGGAQTITFAASLTASGPATIDLNGNVLELDDTSGKLTIQGPGANLLTLDAQSKSGVFSVDGGSSAEIDGLSITGGNSSGINNGGVLVVTGCYIYDNLNGGGINCDDGGAGYGSTTVSDCTITDNTAASYGGGIALSNGNVLTVALALTNCTITANTAGTSGGGIDNDNGLMSITDCTIVGNTAPSQMGGGIFNNSVDNYAVCTLHGTIVAGNTGGDLSGGGINGTYNLIRDGSGGLSAASSSHNILGTASSPIDPLLAQLGNYGGPTQTMALLPNSPAIGHGASFNVTTDQRGFPRPGPSGYDIGAFQTQANPLVVNTTLDDPIGVGLLSLRDATNLADAMGGNQTITFGASLTASGPATIDLNGNVLELDDTSGKLTIQGPGANLLTLDAQSKSGVFS
ncbi:MAG: right-handed parallel beta-helix repeat-containing protein, partial [Tepidisphaeraceae bacterium]